MISVYQDWSESERDTFYSENWGVASQDWWDDFICCEFKQEWTCNDLITSLKEDIVANTPTEEIKVKYLK
jgi:hypothetical protein